MEIVKHVVEILAVVFKVMLGVCVVLFVPILYETVRTFFLKKEVKKYLSSCELRLKGGNGNRFIADYDTLRKAFPNKSSYYLLLVWEDLVKDGTIRRDKRDGEWVIWR